MGNRTIEERVHHVLESINAAAVRSGRRGSDVHLVLASKKQSTQQINRVLDLVRQAGSSAIVGESYLQEFAAKRADLVSDCTTHMIGPLQSNKVAAAVKLFNLIESVHSEKVLMLINKEAAKLGKIMPIYLQVNISADPQKQGFAPAEVERCCRRMGDEYPHISLCGLMTITELYPEAGMVRADFARMRKVSNAIQELVGDKLEISMGMSSDYPIAIEEGATHVRIGTAIFGERG